MIWLLAGLALAEAPDEAEKEPLPPPAFELHGDLKSFFTATIPYDHDLLMPNNPQGQGVVNGRLKLTGTWGDFLDFEAHHAVTAQQQANTGSAGLVGTGAGLQAPQAVDLNWQEPDGPGLVTLGVTDRLVATYHTPGLDVALGRQPITFGTGLFFTPMDLVNPFNPATIDTEYKPGVDALRIDKYFGMTGKVTLAAAYAGSWDLEGTVLAGVGQTTVGVTDLSVLVGAVRGDYVVGTGFASGVGAVGLHGDATFTVPETDGADPFVRAVVGADGRPTQKTTVSGELYLQTLGGEEPADYLRGLPGIPGVSDPDLSARLQRGELWQLGRYYAGLSVVQELSPLLTGNFAIISNVADPSALLAPSLSWSVGDNTTAAFGGYVGVGERPGTSTRVFTDPISGSTFPVELPRMKSEFGLYPGAVFVTMRSYF